VLGQRAIGVSIVTAKGAEGPAGFLALSAAHVTAEPPSMLVSIDDSTSALAAITYSRHFAVNYLPADAKDLAEAFGGKTELKGPHRFHDGEWETLESGAPVLKRAIGVIDCELAASFRHGATTIAVGYVRGLRSRDSDALVFYRGQYRSL
jgi:flavin reductase (DIM6/NTAB) family NADH-FMN oxidoreductase RutF